MERFTVILSTLKEMHCTRAGTITGTAEKLMYGLFGFKMTSLLTRTLAQIAFSSWPEQM
jgi:hypothetical protein